MHRRDEIQPKAPHRLKAVLALIALSTFRSNSVSLNPVSLTFVSPRLVMSEFRVLDEGMAIAAASW